MNNCIKRSISLLLIVILTFSVIIISTASSTSYNGITGVKTPVSKVSLKYAKKLGSGYKNSPTAPIVVGDTLITVAGGKLYKLKASDGSVISSVTTAGTNQYSTVSPCVANGMIFVQLDDGIVQAFDYDSLNSLWVYHDKIGGQALCDITYSGGYIYTGFWVSEVDYANYVCINVKDENPKSKTEAKSAKWTYKSLGGFYWASSCVNGNYVIFGCDNGQRDSTSASKIVALNKSTGKKVSSLAVNGDIRSGIAYDSSTKRYFVSSKAGYLYSFSMNSSTGALGSKKILSLIGPATATPVIYNGRLYLGASNGATGGRFYVINTSTLKTIYFGTLDGYPQASVLVSNAYESTGKIYIYITVNAKPGSLYMFTDSENQNTVSKTLLYSPEGNYSEYCISRVTASSDGTLYYKNDSATIFALKSNTGSDSGSLISRLFNNLITILKSLFGM